MRYWSAIRKLLKTNVWATIAFNLRHLPFKQARHLPVWLYPNVSININMGGGVEINAPISFGMIKIGKNNYYPTTIYPKCNWRIIGTVVFNGKINFLQGSDVFVAPDATLSFGTDGAFCGSDFRCYCHHGTRLGNRVHITWECCLDDSDGEIRIGDYVWIGNRTTINGSTLIPDNTIIASNSTLQGDYSVFGENNLLAGNPAKVKTENVSRR